LEKFVGSEYKGRVIVVETKPTRMDSTMTPEAIKKNILRVYYYDGVFPTTDLSSVFDAQVQDNSEVQLNVQFKFDGYPLDHTNSKTLQLAANSIKNANLYQSAMSYYDNLYGRSKEEKTGAVASSKSEKAKIAADAQTN
jgi:hypothetical protein